MVPRKSDREGDKSDRLGPLSMHGLDPRDAIRAMFEVQPPEDEGEGQKEQGAAKGRKKKRSKKKGRGKKK